MIYDFTASCYNGKSTAQQCRTVPNRASTATNDRKPKASISQRRKKIKRNRRIASLVAVALAFVGLLLIIHGADGISSGSGDTPDLPVVYPSAGSTVDTATPETAPHYFSDPRGALVDMEHMTDAWAAEAGMDKRYILTDAERYELAQVITAEAGGEPYAGMLAVAQCILQSAEDDGIRPTAVLTRYGYTKRRPEPSKDAISAVGDVFDLGRMVSKEPIKYFYAPALCTSEWHESQVYVMTINGHKFFKEATQ